MLTLAVRSAQPPLTLTGVVLTSGVKYRSCLPFTASGGLWRIERWRDGEMRGERWEGREGEGTEEGRVTQDCVCVWREREREVDN